MGLLELTTKFKGLKHSDSGTRNLLVSKDINDPPNTGGISMQINHRIDDLVRHTKMLARKPGLKFLGNQALLAQTNIKQDIAKFMAKDADGNPLYTGKQKLKALGDKAKKTLIDTVLATASTLAQIPVNGTGTHLIRGLKDVSYLGKQGMKQAHLNAPDGSIIPNGTPKDGLQSFIVDDNYQITGLGKTTDNKYNNGDTWIPAFGTELKIKADDYLNVPFDVTDTVKTSGTAYPTNNGEAPGFDRVEGGSKLKDKETPLSNLDKPVNRINPDEVYTTLTHPDGSTQGSVDKEYRLYQDDKVALEVDVNNARTGEKDKIELNKENGTYNEVNTNNSSQKRISRTSAPMKKNYETYLDEITVTQNKSKDGFRDTRESNLADKADAVQSLAVQTATILGSGKEDIIPFEFNTFYPGNTTGNFLYFRAFLNDFNDNFTGDWAGTKYVGRGEELYNYQGFKRDISFSFKVAAFSKADMQPLYSKLNLLVGSTAPTYKNGNFMMGTLTKVTIGDYLNQTSGFISNVGLSWDSNIPWEMETEGEKLPHALDVSISFTPIHDFIPTANSTFIG